MTSDSITHANSSLSGTPKAVWLGRVLSGFMILFMLFDAGGKLALSP